MPGPQYIYRAALIRVVDGDTQVLAISLGCFVTTTRTVRLLGLNTQEIIGPDKARGLASAQVARDWFAAAATANPGAAWPLVVATQLDADDKYGRLLATVYAAGDERSLNQALLEGGWAVVWDGHGPRP
jgi:micrococcal nuclease